MLVTLHARVKEEGLLPVGGPVLVLLSGGRDSVCLLHVARSLCGAEQVRALHVNYGLRASAGADEEHCRQLCERLAIALTVHRPSRRGGNTQAWAREERYGRAAELAEGTAALIATGHTADDQVETILYRLASSPSRRALLGMRPRAGRLIWPLLTSTRQETTGYCREQGLAWREDPSNEAPDFARGRIRTELVPALRRVHPAAEANVLALAELLREEAGVLDRLVEDVLGGSREVPMARLRALPLPLARLVLQRLADEARGRPAPGTARRAPEILALGERAELHLPHGIRAVVGDGMLRLSART